MLQRQQLYMYVFNLTLSYIWYAEVKNLMSYLNITNGVQWQTFDWSIHIYIYVSKHTNTKPWSVTSSSLLYVLDELFGQPYLTTSSQRPPSSTHVVHSTTPVPTSKSTTTAVTTQRTAPVVINQTSATSGNYHTNSDMLLWYRNRLRMFYFLFVCLFKGYRYTREFFTHIETSPLPVKGFKFWPMLGSHGHWAVRVL